MSIDIKCDRCRKSFEYEVYCLDCISVLDVENLRLKYEIVFLKNEIEKMKGCKMTKEKLISVINRELVMERLEIDEPSSIYPETIIFKRIGNWNEIVELLVDIILKEWEKGNQ